MRRIKDYPDYFVTEEGEAWSFKCNKKKKLTPANKVNGYLAVGLCKKGEKPQTFYLSRLIAEAYLENFDQNLQVDHINGDKKDNRVENLRMATRGENCRAFRRTNKNALSQYRGVTFHKNIKKWITQIWVEGKQMHLGYFTDETEAARAYDRAAIEYNFDLQALNFSLKDYLPEAEYINGDASDYRIENLTIKIPKQFKSSKYRGVCFDKQRKKWAAYIFLNKKNMYLGRFSEEQDAALAYDKAAIKNNVHHEKLNFPNLIS